MTHYKQYRSIGNISEARRNKYLAESYSLTKPFMLGIDYLRKVQGLCIVAFISELKKVEIIFSRITYYRLMTGRRHTISTFQIGAIANYFHVAPLDLLMIGRDIEAGRTPDLSRYGIHEAKEREKQQG